MDDSRSARYLGHAVLLMVVVVMMVGNAMCLSLKILRQFACDPSSLATLRLKIIRTFYTCTLPNYTNSHLHLEPSTSRFKRTERIGNTLLQVGKHVGVPTWN